MSIWIHSDDDLANQHPLIEGNYFNTIEKFGKDAKLFMPVPVNEKGFAICESGSHYVVFKTFSSVFHKKNLATPKKEEISAMTRKSSPSRSMKENKKSMLRTPSVFNRLTISGKKKRSIEERILQKNQKK